MATTHEPLIAVLIPAHESDSIITMALPWETTPLVDALNNLVDGDVGSCYVPSKDIEFYANDNGKNQNLPINWRATAYYRDFWNGRTNDFLVGDVIVLGRADTDGNVTSVKQPEQVIEHILRCPIVRNVSHALRAR